MSVHRGLAAVALVGGVLATLAGSPYRADRAVLDAAGLARAIATEADHVTAIELARWIRDGKTGLRVLDVSDADPMMNLAVPLAEPVPMSELPAFAATVRPSDPVVVYSAGGAHGGQAWVLLRALGFTDVYFLQGGLEAWIDEVLAPVLPTPEALTDEAQRRAVESIIELSLYFGGEPRVGRTPDATEPVVGGRGAGGDAAPTLADRVREIRRRGC
jgi:rhodanese-related sulfurtransferase